MSALRHEWRLLARSRLSLAALALLLAISALAVFSGMREVARQRATIERLDRLQLQDLAAQTKRHARGADADAGALAYYSFHGTWDPPSTSAFIALGLRDAAPFAMRVRALALQAQLHEGEQFNPELALAGRFDYAFVLIYLAPLFLIALLGNLVSGERQSGRLGMLLALPGSGPRLWLLRAALRVGLAFACLIVPVVAGALLAGMPLPALGAVALATAAYLAFWGGLGLWVAAGNGSETTHAIRLMGLWVLLTLVLPTMAQAVISRAVPVRAGMDLVLAQRQLVHGAWDLPREETMERFFRHHPQWRDTPPLPAGFRWKWYFAFQQLGDEEVASQVDAYRNALLARQHWTDRLAWLLPGVGVQVALHRQAGTDLLAQMRYQDRISSFHARLREFYYPFFFKDRRMKLSDLDARPGFEATSSTVFPLTQLLILLLMAVAMVMQGVRALGRVSPARTSP